MRFGDNPLRGLGGDVVYSKGFTEDRTTDGGGRTSYHHNMAQVSSKLTFRLLNKECGSSSASFYIVDLDQAASSNSVDLDQPAS